MPIEGGIAVRANELKTLRLGRCLLDQGLEDLRIVELCLDLTALTLDLYSDHTRKAGCCITPEFSCGRSAQYVHGGELSEDLNRRSTAMTSLDLAPVSCNAC